MFCRFVEKNLSAYLDNETNKFVTFLIFRHLAGCNSCRRKLDFLSALSRAVKQKEEIKLSADYVQILKTKIEEEKNRSQTVPVQIILKPAFALKFGLSALCLLLLGASVVLVLPKQHEKEVNQYATVAFQTKAEIVDTGSGLEFATFTNQTRR